MPVAKSLMHDLYFEKAFTKVLEQPWLVLIEMVWGVFNIINLQAAAKPGVPMNFTFLLIFGLGIAGALALTIVMLRGKRKPPENQSDRSAYAILGIFLVLYVITGITYAGLLMFSVLMAFATLGKVFGYWTGLLYVPLIAVFSLIHYAFLRKSGQETSENVAKVMAVFLHAVVIVSLAIGFFLA
jgi:hypothetical protein